MKNEIKIKGLNKQGLAAYAIFNATKVFFYWNSFVLVV